MSRPDLDIAELTRSIDGGAEVFAVHYACESFYEPLDHPPMISAISISTVPVGEDTTFSLIDTPNGDSEVVLLRRFYEWLRSKPDSRIVHWNMNKTEYGFGAIANRYRFLTGEEPSAAHSQDRTFDLDDLIRHRHGVDYAQHPRLGTVIRLNNISTRYSLAGPEQAERFKAGAHADLARSTAERARSIAQLARLFAEGRLQTERSGPAVHFAGVAIDSVDAVVALGTRIRDVALELSRRHGGRPARTLDDEYDYQDLLRALLRLFFDDVRPEDVASEVAGATSRIDFVLPEVGLAVEIKVTREALDAKKLGEELIVDTRRYQGHQHVRHLVCLVFDLDDRLENPRGLERDLSESRDGIAVTVRIFR